jgi:hypothetical protein
MTSRQRHIISILLQNEVGALTRVASLFSTRARRCEIELRRRLQARRVPQASLMLATPHSPRQS